MASKSPLDNAKDFLALMGKEPALRAAVDEAVNEGILSAATKLGKERGLKFSRADLEKAIAEKLGLGEFRLAGDAVASKCNSDSGCRTPCLYCKSKARLPLEDISRKFKISPAQKR